GAAQVEPALARRGRHRDIPPFGFAAQDRRLVHTGILEEHLTETRLTIKTTHRTASQPRRIHRHQEIREAPMTLRLGISTENTKQPIRERAARGPGLLPIDHEPLAVANRLGLDTGEIAPRVRFGPTLSPDLFATGHLRQIAILLFLRTELEQRRAEQRHTVGGYAKRTASGVVLLFEDQPLDQRAIAAAVD